MKRTLLLLLCISTPALAARPMTVEDLWSMERVSAPAVSPDGRTIVFTVTTHSMEDNKANADLWTVPVDGGAPPRRLTWNPGPDGGAVFSPDGSRIAFVSKRGDAPAQLHVLSLGGGEAEPVTDLPVPVSDPRWLPDGQRIAFVASTWPDLDADFGAVRKRLEERKKDDVGAIVSDNRLYRFWDRWLEDGTAPHIFVVDLRTRQITDLLPGSRRLMDLTDGGGDFDVSPDGTRIVFSANATDPPYRTLHADLFAVSTSGGEVTSLTADHPADDLRPRFSPDGRFLVWGRTMRPDHDADFVRLVRRDLATGETVELTPGWDAAPAGWTITPDGRSVVFSAEERGLVLPYVLPMTGGTPRALERAGTAGDLDAAARGLVVGTWQSLTRPAEIRVWRLEGGPPRDLTSLNRRRMDEMEPLRTESVTYPGAGGAAVQMFVVYPPGFREDTRWPLVLLLHGGPHGAFSDSFHYRWNAALVASRGYVVALPNFHGSTGFGQTFAESIVGAHGDKPFADVVAAVDTLVARGFVDPKRVAAAGGSYGGYLTALLLGRTDRFAALVVHAGVYDLMAQFASDATYARPRNYGGSPWEDPAAVDRWSPSRLAANFRTPTLVLHGEKDYRVPLTQGLNLYNVLTAKGVPARLVVFPNENHWVLKPQASRLWWREVFAWLERYLAPAGAGA